MDINVEFDGYTFTCRSVGIIKKDNKILFQKRINDKYYALPGGKINVGESSLDTVKREIYEEIGINVNVKCVHSVIENFFMLNDKKYHQYIFCYMLDIDNDSYIYEKDEFMDLENKNIIYKWIDINNLDNELIKPDYLYQLLKNADDNVKFIINDEINIGGDSNG